MPNLKVKLPSSRIALDTSSGMDTEPLSSRNYDPAFAEQDANIVLQSSDGVFYRIPSFTLRTTSGFFREMMTLPQPDSPSPDHDENPITLDETSEALGKLLRMISGFEISEWKSLDEAENLLAAAYKYDMPGPLSAMRAIFRLLFAAEQPLRSYAIAAQHGWEAEAKIASKHSLKLNIYNHAHAPLLERVPSTWLLRLFCMHRARIEAFKKQIIQPGMFTGQVFFGIMGGCENCSSEQTKDALSSLARVMLSEMERCPEGGILLGRGWRDWPETKRCVKVHDIAHCYKIENKIISALEDAFKSLPCTV